MLDHYQILGLKRTASAEQIRIAYKDMAKRYHPDKNNNDPHAEEVFKRINAAYQVLSDKTKKYDYDHPTTHPKSTHYRTSEPTTVRQKKSTTYRASGTYYQASSRHKYEHIPLRVRRMLQLASVVIGVAVLAFGVYLYEVAPRISARHSYEEAVVLVAAHKYKEALKKLNHAVIFYPQLVEAQMLRADLSYRIFKHYAEAYVGYSEAIKYSEEALPPNVFFLRGMAAFKAQKYRRAINDFSQTISDNPEGNQYSAQAHFFRAQAQYYVNPYHKAAICNDLTAAKEEGVKGAHRLHLFFCESIAPGAIQNIGLSQGLDF
ncbi:DnaJ domain-containing protein [uncultured Microscilla sp.]|uniref:DnaJ domain-containing protein n=1 Tax=uncultured Microscilla sp. TaxID=432653 RepID=UPI00261B4ECD|nr:DnaJ domain-containing protein [uncultured Microscilla sp.]